jgi:hypothetical protein
MNWEPRLLPDTSRPEQRAHSNPAGVTMSVHVCSSVYEPVWGAFSGGQATRKGELPPRSPGQGESGTRALLDHRLHRSLGKQLWCSIAVPCLTVCRISRPVQGTGTGVFALP